MPAREIVNFGGNVEFSPQQIYAPRTENELLEILERHAQGRIRVVASRHSWSPLIISSDVIVDLRHFDQVEAREEHPGEVLVSVGGGCRIKHLLKELHSRTDSTLPSLGLITEQTIAGAISTGTHGSGRQSLSHCIVEIRAAAYDPQTGQARIFEWNSGPELRAARCGLGCLGIIVSVAFRAVPQYLVAERVERCRGIDAVLAGESAHPLQQFYLVPHLWSWFVQRRQVAAANRRSWFAGLYRAYWFLGIDVGLHVAIKLLAAVLRSRALVRLFYRWLLAPFIVKNVTIVDESQRTLVMEHELFRHFEMEVFVPAGHLRAAARFVQDVLLAFDRVDGEIAVETVADLKRIGMDTALAELRGTYTHHYAVTFRRVLPDDTLISMTADASEPYYAVSFITYVEPRDAFRAMATFLLQGMLLLYDARPHWGKFCPLASQDAARLYPHLGEFREICLRYDPRGVFRNEFVTEVLGFTR